MKNIFANYALYMYNSFVSETEGKKVVQREDVNQRWEWVRKRALAVCEIDTIENIEIADIYQHPIQKAIHILI